MKVSVVMPLYNKDQFVRKAICSVLFQSFQDFEIVVVNDGSTDRGADAVRSLGDPRITLIEQPNAGVSAARNAGIRVARGEWIAFLDADDVWLPDNLESHMALLAGNPDLQWSAGWFERRSKRGKEKLSLDLEFLARHREGEVVRDALALLSRGFVWTGAVVVRRGVFAEVGFLDPALRTAEDLDMWLRIALRHPRLGYCAKPIALYSVEVDNSLTRQRVQNPSALPHFLFARKHLPLAATLTPERGDCLREVARGLVRIGIKKLLLSGHAVVAVRMANEFKELLGAGACAGFRWMALAPAPFLRRAFALKQMLKRC